MPRHYFTAFTVILISLLPLHGANEGDLEYILQRYLDSMGGSANLEQIHSVRLQGYFEDDEGNRNPITVLKKKPDLVRITIQAGPRRIVQAFNGEFPWFQVSERRQSITRKMEGPEADVFIREAPLENILISRDASVGTLSLLPEKDYMGIACFVVRATYADGGISEFYIDKATYLERLIVEMDSEGNNLATLIPSRYESFNGILFAMKLVRQIDGKTQSTLMLDTVEINMGMLDVAFSPDKPLE